MSKKVSASVRLDASLIAAAGEASEIEHRSPAKQIEYWAKIGRVVSKFLDANMIHKVVAGSFRVTAEPVSATAPEFEAVMAAMDADTTPPRERVGLTPNQSAYQASREYPGYLERVSPDGTVQVGKFKEGEFHAIKPSQAAKAG